jgi:hypothetical protein
LKWSKAAVAGFQKLVSQVEKAKELGVSRTDLLQGSAAPLPRLEEALAFALEKYIILEVGIGKEEDFVNSGFSERCHDDATLNYASLG